MNGELEYYIEKLKRENEQLCTERDALQADLNYWKANNLESSKLLIQKAIDSWNNYADEFNQWDTLDMDEKLEALAKVANKKLGTLQKQIDSGIRLYVSTSKSGKIIVTRNIRPNATLILDNPEGT